MNLTQIHTGETVTITAVKGHHHIHERLTEMGFVAGRDVTLLYRAPIGTPLIFDVLGTQVALRHEEAANVHTGTPLRTDAHANTLEDLLASVRASAHRVNHLKHFGESPTHTSCQDCALCKKECAQRRCTGSSTDPGATLPRPLTVALIGNPNCGKTSLFNALTGSRQHTGNYSGVTVSSIEARTTYQGVPLRVIDLPGTYSLHAFSPEEAYVAHELIDGDIDLILNVIDVNALERNLLLTIQTRMLGIPMIGALNLYDEFRASHSTLDIAALQDRLGIRLVPTVARTGEGIRDLLEIIVEEGMGASGFSNSRHFEGRGDETPQRLLEGIYRKEVSPAERITGRIDRLAAASWLAYPLFGMLLWLIFYLTFTLGQYPMDWIDAGINALAEAIPAADTPILATLRSLVTEGVIGGVGSVIVFLPNILILYALLTILEDSGYLARAALLADPMLSRFGLHGKSFIPMLMGFGCNVPAIMATRTIETGKSRLLTLLVLPLMSCSARIPIYTAFAGAFFPRHAALIMLSLYTLGIVAAIAVSSLLNRAIMRGHDSHFVMELPPYRLPDWRSVMTHTCEKALQYLRKMATVILLASIAIWTLNNIRVTTGDETADIQEQPTLMHALGKSVAPIFAPLGFDWRMTVGLISGIGAKEMMISTLGVLYGAEESGDTEAHATRLQTTIAANTTPAAALAYMVFALLYFPCIATLVAIKNETGHRHHAAFTACYATLLAYLLAAITYWIAS